VLRLLHKADITICIPAFQAAGFIDRTLRCAQGQTYSSLRIIVSVDLSTDDTLAICHQFAALDRRIEVLPQVERRGWYGNVNALLEKADTEFFFLYFHDDLILPQYCEHLRAALKKRSDAASAHCDLFDFGRSSVFRPGRTYEGSVAKRILTLWGVPERGTPLRSMIRADKVGSDFRLPVDEKESVAPGQTLLVRMVAAGPAVRVPETLYLRWQREDGLTGGWRQLPHEQLVDGWKADVAKVFALIDQLVTDSRDRRDLKIAQILHALLKLSKSCRRYGRRLPEPTDIHPDSPAIDIPDDIDRFGSEIAKWMRGMHHKVCGMYGDSA